MNKKVFFRKNAYDRSIKWTKKFQNLDTLYNVSINDSSKISICSNKYTSISVSTRKNCVNILSPIYLDNQGIKNLLIGSVPPNAQQSSFTDFLKHLTNILLYLKINQNISYLNNKINQYLISHEGEVPLKRNYLKKIILNPKMVDFNSFNLEDFAKDWDEMVKKKNKIINNLEFIEKKRIHLDTANSDNLVEDFKKNQIEQSDVSLHKITSHGIRCFSEPPNLNLNKNFSLFLESKSDKCFINNSPAIKILFNNFVKKRQDQIFPLSASQSLYSIRIEDFVHMYKCKNLILKRSFSSNRIKLDKEIIKKSPSFEKFLKNILQGKKKSNSLCNFSTGSKNFSNSDCNFTNKDSTRESSSSVSDNLDNMMVSLMNGKKKSSWPILKIDDQVKNDIEKKEKIEVNNNGYIPDNVRNALEQAGIDIGEIIDMTNQLQMSFKNDMNFKKTMVKSHTFSNEYITTTRTIFTNEEKENFDNKLQNVIENLKSFEINQDNVKSNGELIYLSNIKNFEIKQNLNAKISQQVENVNEQDENPPERPMRNNRKKSYSNRYATVSNFKLSVEDFKNCSPDNKDCSEHSPTIIPPKVVSQFKPIVNIHKRLSTQPAAEMNKIISSKSTDAFSNLTDSYEYVKDQPECNFIELSQGNRNEVNSNLDLNEQKSPKRGNVIRSLSYNIGKAYDKTKKSDTKKLVNDLDSFGKVIEICKSKKALFIVNESLDLCEMDTVSKNCVETKNFSGLNSDRADPVIVAGRLNNAIIHNPFPNIEVKQIESKLNSFLGPIQRNTDTLLISKSSNDLPNSFSTSSLSGILPNDFYKNNEQFLFVSFYFFVF